MVQRRVASTPARAASRVPEQIVTQAVRRVPVEERVVQPIVQPSGGHRDLRRDPGHVGRRLADHHDPGRRPSSSGNGSRSPSASPTDVGRVAAGPAKRRRKRGGSPRAFAVQVGETKGFGRPGDVEQQRVPHDDEEDVDEVVARDHGQRRPPNLSIYQAERAAGIRVRTSMSETDSKLSALRRDRDSGARIVRRGRGRAPRFGIVTQREATSCASTRSPRASSSRTAAVLLARCRSSWWWLAAAAPQAADGPTRRGSKARWTRASPRATISSPTPTGAGSKATALPAGKERWGARDELEEVTRRRIAALIDAAGAGAPAGSAARKVADFHAAWLNEAAIEARGLAPLEPLLDRIEKVSDKAELTRLLGRGMRADVDPLGLGTTQSAGVLGLSVEQSIHGEKTNVAFLVQGGLGLPDREDYLSTEPAKAALRARYRDYIRRMLTLAGLSRADERGSAVFALETAIAESQGTREASANDRNADHVWTRADFVRRAPGMDWTAFFDAAGLSGQEEFVAWQAAAVTGVAALVASQPLEAWKDYLLFHADPRFRGRAAARIRRRGAGAEGRRGGRFTALPRRARARGHAIGHERCAREDVRRALFPCRREGARGAHLRQCPRGAHEAGRGRDVDVAGHQGERVVEARDAVRGDRVSRSMGGLFLADRGPGGPAGQPRARLSTAPTGMPSPASASPST